MSIKETHDQRRKYSTSIPGEDFYFDELRDGLVENAPVEMRVDEMTTVDGIVNFVVDVKSGYRSLSSLTKSTNPANADKGYAQPQSHLGRYLDCLSTPNPDMAGMSNRCKYGIGSHVDGMSYGKSSVCSGGSGGINSPSEISVGGEWGSTGEYETEHEQSGTDSGEKLETVLYAGMTQINFLLCRTLQRYPDVEEVFDKISDRIFYLSTAIRKERTEPDGVLIGLETGFSNRRRSQNSRNVSPDCSDIFYPGTGYPILDEIMGKYKMFSDVVLRDPLSNRNGKTDDVVGDEPLILGDVLGELLELRKYLSQFDFWNGPVRGDVDFFVTTDFSDECPVCREERTGGLNDGVSFGYYKCDHMVGGNVRTKEDAVSVSYVRRYVYSLLAPNWSQTIRERRIRLAMWCLQEKIVPFDYGCYAGAERMTVSVFTKRMNEALLKRKKAEDVEAGRRTLVSKGLGNDNGEKKKSGKGKEKSDSDEICAKRTGGVRARKDVDPFYVPECPGVIPDDEGIYRSTYLGRLLKLLSDRGDLPTYKVTRVRESSVKTGCLTNGYNFWYDANPGEWSEMMDGYAMEVDRNVREDVKKGAGDMFGSKRSGVLSRTRIPYYVGYLYSSEFVGYVREGCFGRSRRAMADEERRSGNERNRYQFDISDGGEGDIDNSSLYTGCRFMCNKACGSPTGEKRNPVVKWTKGNPRTFMYSQHYLTDWPLVWNMCFPHYQSCMVEKVATIFPGLFGNLISEGGRLDKGSGMIKYARSAVRSLEGAASTLKTEVGYGREDPTVSFVFREMVWPRLTKDLKSAMDTTRMRGGEGIPWEFRRVLDKVVKEYLSDFGMMNYLAQRSPESNITDSERHMWMNEDVRVYSPGLYMEGRANIKSGGVMKVLSTKPVSAFADWHRNRVVEFMRYYGCDSDRVTDMYDMFRFCQDCYREERSQHINIATFSEELAGVGKTWMLIILSYMLLTGMIRQVGFESRAVTRVVSKGRNNMRVEFRDEVSINLFSSKNEGGMADPRIKELLGVGYTTSTTMTLKPDHCNTGNFYNAKTGFGGYGHGNSAKGQDFAPSSGRHGSKRKRTWSDEHGANGSGGKRRRGEGKESDRNGRELEWEKGDILKKYETEQRMAEAAINQRVQESDYGRYGGGFRTGMYGGDGYDGSGRRNVNRLYEAICPWITSCNYTLEDIKDFAMRDRFVIKRFSKSRRRVEGKRRSVKDILDSVPMGVINRSKSLQIAHLEVRKMITAGVIKDPSVEVVTILRHLLNPVMKNHGIKNEALNRFYLMTSAAVKIDCIQRVIHGAFMVPEGKFYRRTITPSRLRDLEPEMYATTQDVVFAFGSIMTQYVTNTDRFAVDILRDSWERNSSEQRMFSWYHGGRKITKLTKDRKVVLDAMTGSAEYADKGMIPDEKKHDAVCITGSDSEAMDNLLSNSIVREGSDDSWTRCDSGNYEGPYVTDGDYDDAFDYNYVVCTFPESTTDVVSQFVKQFENLISTFFEEERIDNVNIPEIAEVELYVKKMMGRRLVGARRMVHRSSPLCKIHGFMEPYMDGEKRRTFSRSCDYGNVVALLGKENLVPGVPYIRVMGKRQIGLSTFWLTYGTSPFGDVVKIIQDIHGHNLFYSPGNLKNRREWLLFGVPHESKPGHYHEIPPRCTLKSLSGDTRYFIPKNALATNCIPEECEITRSECEDDDDDDDVVDYNDYETSRVSSTICERRIEGSTDEPRVDETPELEVPMPEASLDDLVKKVREDELDAPRALTDDFLYGVSFLVNDSEENRLAVSEIRMVLRRSPGGREGVPDGSIIESCLRRFVKMAGCKIPDSCLMYWFIRTKIPPEVLRTLFCERFFVIMAFDGFLVNMREGGGVKMSLSSGVRKALDVSLVPNTFTGLPGFKAYFYDWYESKRILKVRSTKDSLMTVK